MPAPRIGGGHVPIDPGTGKVWGSDGAGNATPVDNGGSSSAVALKETLTQTGHGFTTGVATAVRWNGTAWVKSQGDSGADADVDVLAVASDADTFTAYYPGSKVEEGLADLTSGEDYYLDPTTEGALTATEPTTSGDISEPVLKALSATTGIFAPKRGLEQPDPATKRFRIILIADGTAVATGEDFASYTYEVGADLDGWSLTDVVWYLKTVSSSGAPSFGVRKGSTEMLTTNVTVDANETSSRTAATPRVIASDGSQTVAAGDIIHFDCDAAGTGAKGSAVELEFTSP